MCWLDMYRRMTVNLYGNHHCYSREVKTRKMPCGLNNSNQNCISPKDFDRKEELETSNKRSKAFLRTALHPRCVVQTGKLSAKSKGLLGNEVGLLDNEVQNAFYSDCPKFTKMQNIQE
jgi:hypothetical protein